MIDRFPLRKLESPRWHPTLLVVRLPLLQFLGMALTAAEFGDQPDHPGSLQVTFRSASLPL
jgi:hypothetical protein